MQALLEALQEGRLIELPEGGAKERAFTILGNLIEAIPSVPTGTDVVGAILAREETGSTALGRGWACPHARIQNDGDLVCAVGWSPQGIDYGAPDGKPVSLLAMYLVPANQKNAYLKEISGIAKALQAQTDSACWARARSLGDIRNCLLDLVSTTSESAVPDARARMIRLEARQAAPLSNVALAGLNIHPLSIVGGVGVKPTVLAQNRELVDVLEALPGLLEKLQAQGVVDAGNWRILNRGVTSYQADRVLFDCLAVRVQPPRP